MDGGNLTLEPLHIIGQVLRLRDLPFETLLTSQQGLRLSVGIVLLAGLSEAIGQSLVLFANRVSKRRFIASLLLSANLYVFGFLFWSISIHFVAEQLFGRERDLLPVIKAVGLAYAPYLFGFFVLTPYWGNGIAVALSLWSLLTILAAVQVTLSLSLWQALVCSALGWLLLQLLRQTLGRPVIWSTRWLRRRIAGVPLVTDPKRLKELLKPSKKEEF